MALVMFICIADRGLAKLHLDRPHCQGLVGLFRRQFQEWWPSCVGGGCLMILGVRVRVYLNAKVMFSR